MRIIGIDPDLHNTGMAVVYGNRLEHIELISIDKDLKAEAAVAAMCLALKKRLTDRDADLVVIERPVIYVNNTRASESIVLLSLVAGAAGGICGHRPLHFVRPSEWKGQVPKDVIEKRTCRSLFPGHSAEARAGTLRMMDLARDVSAGKLESSTSVELWGHAADAAGLAVWGYKHAQELRTTS